MTWFKRHGASLALAAVLAVIGGTAVGCTTDDPNDGQGGSGGDAGAGGDGGTGGTGGEDPTCGTKTCEAGERCNRGRNPPRCECTSSPDSCTEADPSLYCTATKVCRKLVAEQWDPCDTPGDFTPDGKLWCAGGFGADGSTSYWLEVCTDSNSCTDGLSFCDKVTWGTDGEHGLCYYNFCGDEQKRDGALKNGGNWGACDSEVGNPADASAGSGQCVPFDGNEDEVFLCIPGGQTPLGGPCRFDTDDRADEACAALTICLSPPLRATACETADDCDPLQVCTDNKCAEKTCATDDDCGGTGYCFDDGDGKTCRPFGACSEICNAGTGDSPTCTATDTVCIGALTNRPDFANARGYCGEPGCDMLDPTSCPDEDGQARMCIMAYPVKGHPFMGLCANEPETVLTKGTACEGADVCEQGTLCIGSQTTGKYFCRGLCECPEADWDASTGMCKTAAEQCATTDNCAYFGGAPTLGACIPK